MRLLQFNETRAEFAQRIAADENDREALLGKTVALLNVQPRTSRNINLANDLVTRLIDADGEDAYGQAARYLHARILMMHLDPPDPDQGMAVLSDLANTFPNSFWGQLALLKLAPLKLYRAADTESRAAILDELEVKGRALENLRIRRPFFVVLANVCLDFDEYPERALQYLLAADVDNLQRWQRRADAYIQIAELARASGDYPLALQYYTKFYEEFPRDNRHFMVGELIQDLSTEDAS